MVTKLYVVRHCEAQANVDDIFQGHRDGDITEKGEKQLEKLSEYFKNGKIDIIYSSPLIRAMKTAQAVNKYHGVDIIPDLCLKEIYGGILEGRKRVDIKRDFPEINEMWDNDFANYHAPDGESVRDVYLRMRNEVMRIVTENEGKSIVIASHGAAIRCLTTYLLGIPIEKIATVGWHDNTGISLYEFKDGIIRQVFFNDISHIENDPETAPHQMSCCVPPVK